MRGYFNGQSQPTQPIDQTQQIFFGRSPSANDYFHEVSYGRFGIAGQVTPWLPLAIASTCDTQTLTDAALRATATWQPTFPFLNYHYFVVVAPYDTSGCPDGQAYIGPKLFATPAGPIRAGRAVLQAEHLNLYTVIHELGHAFGLHHAGLLNCDVSVQTRSTCPTWEYGDHFDSMGGAYQTMGGHYDALHKRRLNWLPDGYSQTITQSTVVSIQPLAARTDGVHAIFLQTPNTPDLSIEYRQPIGYDHDLDDPAVFQGALLHSDSDDGRTFLIDPTPPAYSRLNSLLTGERLVDLESGIQIETLSRLPNALTVRILFPRQATPVPIIPTYEKKVLPVQD